ncbi:hypothetical protein OH77DRAFT_1021523 [Trametes cingulata]|nr:hypothetical protein OH77DRAFT_1021523 [Trametes cingulata]
MQEKATLSLSRDSVSAAMHVSPFSRVPYSIVYLSCSGRRHCATSTTERYPRGTHPRRRTDVWLAAHRGLRSAASLDRSSVPRGLVAGGSQVGLGRQPPTLYAHSISSSVTAAFHTSCKSISELISVPLWSCDSNPRNESYPLTSHISAPPRQRRPTTRAQAHLSCVEHTSRTRRTRAPP